MTHVEVGTTTAGWPRMWQSARVLLVVAIVLLALVATAGCAMCPVDSVGDHAGVPDGHAVTRIPPMGPFAAQRETSALGLGQRELGEPITALPARTATVLAVTVAIVVVMNAATVIGAIVTIIATTAATTGTATSLVTVGHMSPVGER